MPVTRLPSLRPWAAALGALVVGLLLAGAAPAQAPRDKGSDTLDRTRRLNEVAAQKMEAEVRSSLLEAQRLSSTDRAKAADRLKTTLAKLEDDTALSDSRRATLVRVLKDRIRVVETDTETADDKNEKRLDAVGRRAEEQRQAEEKTKVKRTLDNISDLKKEGKAEEARRLADDLSRRYPDNPAAQASSRVTSAAEQLETLRDLKRERERSTVAALRDVQKSAVIPREDYEFPDAKKWQELTKRRAVAPVTTKEKAILQALNTTLSVAFKDSRFEDVIDYLSTVTGQPIFVDKMALNAANVTYDTPITLHAKATVRTILRRILNDFGLDYIVKGEAIQVLSAMDAKKTMVVRSYYLGDMVGDGMAGQRFGPGAGQLQMLQNAAQVIDLIQTTVDPETWRVNGGEGTIFFHAPSRSIVIKQSAEVHSMIGGGLLR